MNLTHEGMLPTTGAQPPKTARWYYRCDDCLTPVALEKGARFAIREGGRTVGAGVVTKILK